MIALASDARARLPPGSPSRNSDPFVHGPPAGRRHFHHRDRDLEPDEAATRIQAAFRRQMELRRVGATGSHRSQRLPTSPTVEEARAFLYTGLDGPGRASLTFGNVSSLRSVRTADIGQYKRFLTDKAEKSRWPSSMRNLRVEAFLLFEEPRSSHAAQWLSIAILLFTLISILAFILETVPELRIEATQDMWLAIEVSCTVIFSVELICRFLVCDVGGGTYMQFLRHPMNVTDMVAILPFFVWLAMRELRWAKALAILRIVRLVRLFRIVKLGRYSSGLQLMMIALRESHQALSVLSFFLSIGIVLFSSAIYYVERLECPDPELLQATKLPDNASLTEWDRYKDECHAQPYTRVSPTHGLCCDEYGSALDFPSIPAAAWWAVVTMTTVGFGEVYPRTDLGRIVGTVTMLSGILLIALPIAIVGQKFQEAYEDYAEQQEMAARVDAEILSSLSPVARLSRVVSGNLSASQVFVDRRPSEESGTSKETPSTEGFKSERRAADNVSPAMHDLSRRLRLMQLPGVGLGAAARELAEDFDMAIAMRKEIYIMHESEKAKQLEVSQRFEGILDGLIGMCQNGEARTPRRHNALRAGTSTRSLRGSSSPRAARVGFKPAAAAVRATVTVATNPRRASGSDHRGSFAAESFRDMESEDASAALSGAPTSCAVGQSAAAIKRVKTAPALTGRRSDPFWRQPGPAAASADEESPSSQPHVVRENQSDGRALFARVAARERHTCGDLAGQHQRQGTTPARPGG